MLLEDFIPSFPYTAYVLPPSSTLPRSMEEVIDVKLLPASLALAFLPHCQHFSNYEDLEVFGFAIPRLRTLVLGSVVSVVCVSIELT